jgi:acyl-coenzyme A thioesterase PaaI-like protein
VTPAELGAAMAASVPFVATIGYQITGIEGDRVTVTLPNRPELRNHIGTTHAAVAYGAAETATGAVLLNAVGSRLGELIPVLKNAEIRYTAPAVGTVTAVASPQQNPAQAITACLAAGRALLDVDCTIYSEDGSENAQAAFTWYLRRQ